MDSISLLRQYSFYQTHYNICKYIQLYKAAWRHNTVEAHSTYMSDQSTDSISINTVNWSNVNVAWQDMAQMVTNIHSQDIQDQQRWHMLKNLVPETDIRNLNRIECSCTRRLYTFQTTWNSLTFPVEASKDYPVSSVYRYGQQSLFHINEKQGEAR